MKQSLELGDLRERLRMLEDDIIMDLYKRSRYASNDKIYLSEGLLDTLLKGTEKLHRAAGRYDDRREHPFFPIAPDSKRTEKKGDGVAPVKVNKNAELKAKYIEFVEKLCRHGDDDAEYGTCAVLDINALQDISYRIHLGEFVAEAKWKSNKNTLAPLIKSGKWKEVEEALRDRSVEAKILESVEKKGERYNLDPKFVSTFYLKVIIPLTIEVEIDYLKQRYGLEDL